MGKGRDSKKAIKKANR